MTDYTSENTGPLAGGSQDFPTQSRPVFDGGQRVAQKAGSQGLLSHVENRNSAGNR
jgi:hypothetical protein